MFQFDARKEPYEALISFTSGSKREGKESYPIDTMKAFLILLFTDLLIGFHSPHGWEILIESFLSYLGFAPNRYVVSLFVSTFPVIVDTVLKYWIFRHLNRVSPSIVVTYHTMSE